MDLFLAELVCQCTVVLEMAEGSLSLLSTRPVDAPSTVGKTETHKVRDGADIDALHGKGAAHIPSLEEFLSKQYMPQAQLKKRG